MGSTEHGNDVFGECAYCRNSVQEPNLVPLRRGSEIPVMVCQPCKDEDGPIEFTESPAGYRARERWARHYDDLNGAPEGDWDR